MTNVQVITDKQLAKIGAEAQAEIIHPVLSAAMTVKVTDSETYQVADLFLKKIKAGIRAIDAKLSPSIEPIRAGLDALYELRRGLYKPFEEAEASIKAQMKSWQLAEQRRMAEEERKRRAEEERLRREQEENQRQADQARTKAARERAQAAADEAARQAELTAIRPVAPVTRGTSSSVRKIKKWRVTDLSKLVAAVASGQVVDVAVTVNLEFVNEYFKSQPEEVASWPGIEVYEDIQIVGR